MKIATIFIAVCVMVTWATAQTPKEYPRSAYKAEMLVKFPSSTAACSSAEALLNMTIHLSKGETTKARAISDQECVMLPPTEKYKVLSVKFPADSFMGLLEVTHAKSKLANGFWVYTLGAEPAK